MFEPALSVPILAAACWFFGRHEADFSWWNLSVVALVIGLATEAGVFAYREEMLATAALAGSVLGLVALSTWLMHKVLYLLWRDALMVTLVFLVVRAALAFSAAGRFPS